MNLRILLSLLLIPPGIHAGSLGKYQVDDSRSQQIRIPASSDNVQVDSQLMKQLQQSRELRQKEMAFYNDFEQKVKTLEDDERRLWLEEYREKLKQASSRDAINKQEVTHYTRLITIIQRNM